jgi:hypothetical protein
MKNERINLTEFYGYDSETLAAAEHDAWYSAKTEPRTTLVYQPVKALEEIMEQFISKR